MCYDGDLGYELLGDAAVQYNAVHPAVVPSMSVNDKLTPEPYYGGIKSGILHLLSTKYTDPRVSHAYTSPRVPHA